MKGRSKRMPESLYEIDLVPNDVAWASKSVTRALRLTPCS